MLIMHGNIVYEWSQVCGEKWGRGEEERGADRSDVDWLAASMPPHLWCVIVSLAFPAAHTCHAVPQVLAAVGRDWKPVLDGAVDKFRTAGASEADIRGALRNHSRKDELDLGPDPEEEAAAAAATAAAAAEVAAKEAEAAAVKEAEAAAAAAKAPEAKGLPSLEVKKKAKA